MAPTSILFPGGAKREFEYDPLMRIKKITSFDPGQNMLLNYQYTYDKMDNIRTKATEHGNYVYNYDDLYRLTDDRRPASAESFGYDEVGNRLTSQSGVTLNWAYNQNNELQSYDGVTFQYDANGNTIKKTGDGGLTTVDYTYDIENRLISVTRFSSGVSPFTSSYGYDPFGRRLWKEVDGQKTYFIYCDEGLAGEFDSNGSLTKAYGWKPNSTWTTDPIFMREGESYYYYHNDHLGTPQKLTAQNCLVVWSAKYTAFGEAEIDPSFTITNNLRFPGQYQDEETQLNYNYLRYYDPRNGRYITADPIGLRGGTNLFAYTKNNPLKRKDPFGLDAYDDYWDWVDRINYHEGSDPFATPPGIDWWQDPWAIEPPPEYPPGVDPWQPPPAYALPGVDPWQRPYPIKPLEQEDGYWKCVGKCQLFSIIGFVKGEAIERTLKKTAKCVTHVATKKLLSKFIPIYNIISTVGDIGEILGCFIGCSYNNKHRGYLPGWLPF